MKTQIITFALLALVLAGAVYAATTAVTAQQENERMLVKMNNMMAQCEEMMGSGMMGANRTGMSSDMAAMHAMHHGG